jgi:hypothetical protein
MKVDINFIPKLEGYVIYNPETQLFSSGGMHILWKKKGKIWATIGNLKNHIRLHMRCQYANRGYQVDENGDRFFGILPNEISKFVIPKTYKNCVILDIATGENIELTPNEYLRQIAEKEIEGHYKNWIIVEE